MIFEITREVTPEQWEIDTLFPALVPAQESFTWALVMADGEVVACGPRVFYDEKACRSQIASAKRSMKGASRCKVVTKDP